MVEDKVKNMKGNQLNISNFVITIYNKVDNDLEKPWTSYWESIRAIIDDEEKDDSIIIVNLDIDEVVLVVNVKDLSEIINNSIDYLIHFFT